MTIINNQCCLPDSKVKGEKVDQLRSQIARCTANHNTNDTIEIHFRCIYIHTKIGRKHPSLCIYLFGVLCRFQHCTGHVTTGSWKGRGNQYIQFVRVLYCKLPTNGKQLPAFPLDAVPGIEPQPQRWEARVLPLCHRGPHTACVKQPLKIYRIFNSCL